MARGRSFGTVERTVQRAVTGVHRLTYQLSGGRLGGTLVGNEVVVLTTTGRRSGAKRQTPLFGYRDGDDYIVVASNGGTATDPAWLLNLRADERGTLRAQGKTWPVRAEVLTPEEKAAWWQIVTKQYRGYSSYQEKTDRDIPMVRLRRAPAA